MTAVQEIFPAPELAVERKEEARKVLWALLAAILFHLIVGYFFAILNGRQVTPVPVEEEPIELTMVDLAEAVPAAPKKNSMFVETDESKQSEAPKEKTFESNANSIAAAPEVATGSMPLPSQEGKDRPMIDLDSHNYSISTQGAQAQPSVPPQETPRPSEPPKTEAQPTPVVKEEFAMLTRTPAPTVQPSVAPTPGQVKSSYRPLKEKTRIRGSISNRGVSSVNALGTPLGRYEKIMKDAIGSRWYAYMEQKRELANIGTLQLHFFIDRGGKVKKLKITENTSNEAFANICLQAVLEAQLPPIPDDLANTLPPEGLEIEGMNFIIYPN